MIKITLRTNLCHVKRSKCFGLRKYPTLYKTKEGFFFHSKTVAELKPFKYIDLLNDLLMTTLSDFHRIFIYIFFTFFFLIC